MQCFDPNTAQAGTRVPAYVANSTLARLKAWGVGEVLMVNSAGVYLLAESDVIYLCDISMGRVPSGIAISGFSEIISDLSLQQGDRFTFKDLTLSFPSKSLILDPIERDRGSVSGGRPSAALARAAARDLAALGKTKGISLLVWPLVFRQDREEILSLTPYHRPAFNWLSSLLRAFSDDSSESVRELVLRLLGLGGGLTPSADDVLLGMLYAFRQLGIESKAVSAFRHCVVTECDQRTNRVSAAYLKAIARGECFERIESVWRGLCGLESLDITRLTDLGSSSGSEMLLGVLCALSIDGYDFTEKESFK